MKMVEEEDGNEGEEVVVVGVRLDAGGKELLTWSLMKLARPGVRFIALHVLDDCHDLSSSSSSSPSPPPSPSLAECGGASPSLMSLVKTFDSFLSAYEGFCNLKQVDLKLKVCKASSVKKMVVREAKETGASNVVVGTCTKKDAIFSLTSVAKYCAKKLPKTCSVYSVSNGKIVFQREGSLSQGRSKVKDPKTKKHGSVSCSSNDSSLASVPFQKSNLMSCLNPGLIEGLLNSNNQGLSFFCRLFLPKHHPSNKTVVEKRSAVSTSAVYPDQKQSTPCENENHCSHSERKIDPPVVESTAHPCIGSDVLHMELKGLYDKYSSTCRQFTYAELASATSNFIPENMVGKGGSSHVYKGCLFDGKEVAVKILKPSVHVVSEFVAEVEIVTTIHNKNIISLVGFCFENNNLLLVYDFLSRGSLEDNIHGNKKDVNAFGWRERYKVAVGVAEALHYLHNISDQAVIHRDVKSSNILLCDSFEPQLSDFGLASWASTPLSQSTCRDVAGTFGYLAPEYFLDGKITDKVDVYAYGVVLLELLSGRMPINSGNPKGQESLVMWAKPILENGLISQLLDPQMGSEFHEDEIDSMVLAATLCIQHSPKFRPDMGQVLKLLQGDKEVKDWARHQVCTSKKINNIDGEAFPNDFQSHLNLALLDLDDGYVSTSSAGQLVSIEDYLQGRYSRTSSFD